MATFTAIKKQTTGVLNSVSCETGRKLHQSADDLLRHRQANDEICAAHGLSVLEQPEKRSKKKRMKPGEYQTGLREDSWKLDLIHAINEALEYADSRESFTANDETFRKENLEALFVYRQAVGFRPGSVEPDEGWLGGLAADWLRVGKYLEQSFDLPEPPAPPVWTDSKQRRREALKKLAAGQKLTVDTQSEHEYVGRKIYHGEYQKVGHTQIQDHRQQRLPS